MKHTDHRYKVRVLGLAVTAEGERWRSDRDLTV